MDRTEPTIGSMDLNADPVVMAKLRASAKAQHMRETVVSWLGTLSLFVLIAVACMIFATYADLIPTQLQLGSPKLVGRLLILGGLAVIFAAQALGSILLFHRSFMQGGLSLFVPGYIFFALKRNGLYFPVAGTWCLGVVAVVAGTIFLA